jgi:hypothetical protein
MARRAVYPAWVFGEMQNYALLPGSLEDAFRSDSSFDPGASGDTSARLVRETVERVVLEQAVSLARDSGVLGENGRAG